MCTYNFEIFYCCPPQAQRMRGIEVTDTYNCNTKTRTLGSGLISPSVSSNERFVDNPLEKCKNCADEMSLQSYNPTTSRSRTPIQPTRHSAAQRDEVEHRPYSPQSQGTIRPIPPVNAGNNRVRLDSDELYIPEKHLPLISNSPFEAAGSASVQQRLPQLIETRTHENRYYGSDNIAQHQSNSYDGHSFHSPSDDEDEGESLSAPECESQAGNPAPFVQPIQLPGQHPQQSQQQYSPWAQRGGNARETLPSARNLRHIVLMGRDSEFNHIIMRRLGPWEPSNCHHHRNEER